VNRRWFWVACLALSLWTPLICETHEEASEGRESFESRIQVIQIHGMIDFGLTAFVDRCVKEGLDRGVDAILLDIDTEGGLVEAVLKICTSLDDASPCPTLAYVTDRAWSAGALVGLACQQIVMAPGSTIGSALPVGLGTSGSEAEALGEKYISAIRAKFKAIAEKNGHPVLLAAAMVDPDVEIIQVSLNGTIAYLGSEEVEAEKRSRGEDKVEVGPTVCASGKLLNLTASEAVQYGIAIAEVGSIEEALAVAGWENPVLYRNVPSWSEELVRFLTHPILSGILLTVGVLGIIFELKMPGWGISGTVGLVCLALFFGGRHLSGLAPWTDLLLFLVGFFLLALEIFVIPGFGLTGIAGILCMLAGLYMAMVDKPIPEFPWEWQSARIAVQTMVGSLIFMVLGTILGFGLLPHTPLWRRIGLSMEQSREFGFVAEQTHLKEYLGQTGISKTVLRPSGRARFGKMLLDVQTQGEFLEAGCAIRAVAVHANVLVVEAVEPVADT